MAASFNNLKGWIRDAKRAEADDPDLWSELVEVIEAALAALDDVDGALDGDSPDLDCGDAAGRPTPGGKAGGPTAGSPPLGTPASRLDSLLDLLSGEERVQAQRDLDDLRLRSMGSSGRRFVTGGVPDGT